MITYLSSKLICSIINSRSYWYTPSWSDKMKNLEIKVRHHDFDDIRYVLVDYYAGILEQTDTYFNVDDGRLKLREEDNSSSSQAYFIRYYRKNVSSDKESVYHCYPVADVEEFWKIFASALTQEIVVKKNRELYLYKHARIHLDEVEGLGKFVEIEVLIRDEQEQTDSKTLMDELISMLNIRDAEVCAPGYRELLLQSQQKPLSYYIEQGKLFWTLNEDVNEHLKRNAVHKCLFVEKNAEGYQLLQLDVSIKCDPYRYTAWRSLIGKTYNIQVDVLLISPEGVLYTLDGEVVKFEDVGRSTVVVDKTYLARFGVGKTE